MEKILLIYIIIEKQKLNRQKPLKGLNILISVGFMAVVVLLTGRQMLGFLLGANINGIDIIGILGFTYGTANLIYSLIVDYKEETSQALSSATAVGIEETGGKGKNSDLNIIRMINYGENEKKEKERSDREKMLEKEKEKAELEKAEKVKLEAIVEKITLPPPQKIPSDALAEQPEDKEEGEEEKKRDDDNPPEILFDFVPDNGVAIEEDALTITTEETKEGSKNEEKKTRYDNNKEKKKDLENLEDFLSGNILKPLL